MALGAHAFRKARRPSWPNQMPRPSPGHLLASAGVCAAVSEAMTALFAAKAGTSVLSRAYTR
jgi:hypothetical protein